jgi:DNA-binding NarL/FixJ family response regulator
LQRAASPQAPFRIVLADDHALLRQSLKVLLERRPEVIVVGEAADGREAVTLCERLHPHVVVMDINMPLLNGIDATRQIVSRNSRTRVVIVSAYSEHQQLVDAVRAGALGYVVKRSDIDELITAIRLVGCGNPYFSAELSGSMDIAELIFEARSGVGHNPADDLTPRQKEIVQLLAEGFTLKASAEKLFLSQKTVEGHCLRAMTTLGAKGRADLVRAAIRYGIIELSEAPGA